jgi:hypothetical protein
MKMGNFHSPLYLHREHDDKKNVRIYDYVEHDHPQLARMWEKRRRGYLAMGYVITAKAKQDC